MLRGFANYCVGVFVPYHNHGHKTSHLQSYTVFLRDHWFTKR